MTVGALVHRYAECIDQGDFGGAGELLAHAELTFEGMDGVTVSGRDAIDRLYTATTRRFETGTPRTKHVITNVIAQVDQAAGTAISRSYFTVMQSVPGALALQPVVAGRYRHRYERLDGTWVITGMHVTIDLMGDVSHHLLIDVAPPG